LGIWKYVGPGQRWCVGLFLYQPGVGAQRQKRLGAGRQLVQHRKSRPAVVPVSLSLGIDAEGQSSVSIFVTILLILLILSKNRGSGLDLEYFAGFQSLDITE
jgi:hypothetical protein